MTLTWYRHTGRKQAEPERRLTRGHCVKVRRIQGSDSAYFGHVSLKSLLNAMYEFVTFSIFFFFFAGALDQSLQLDSRNI
jgi:hypothetical protein